MRINWKPYRAANSNIGAMGLSSHEYINIGAFVGVTTEVVEVEEDLGLLGGTAYSYLTPYQKIEKAKKEVVEVKAAIDHAAIERKALQDKLEKALQSKAKKKAETQKKLELKLQQLELETIRLMKTLEILDQLIRAWDEEDALIALAMANPFATITF